MTKQVHIPAELHQQLKAMAVQQGVSLQALVSQALARQLNQDQPKTAA